VAVDLLGHRADLLLGEPSEGVLDELEVRVEVPRALHAAQRAEVLGRPVGAHEVGGGVEGGRFDPPRVLTPEHPRRKLMNGVGHEGTGDPCLVLSLLPVSEDRRGVLDRGRGMGQVIGRNLVRLDVARRGQMPGALVYDGPRQIDGCAGGGEVRVGGHGGENYLQPSQGGVPRPGAPLGP
jgi:hypothetical protein